MRSLFLNVTMNPAEQTVTWLITLGVLESPKKTISDPEGFLQASLKDGVVLCKLLERLRPGSVEKVRSYQYFGHPGYLKSFAHSALKVLLKCLPVIG